VGSDRWVLLCRGNPGALQQQRLCPRIRAVRLAHWDNADAANAARGQGLQGKTPPTHSWKELYPPSHHGAAANVCNSGFCNSTGTFLKYRFLSDS